MKNEDIVRIAMETRASLEKQPLFYDGFMLWADRGSVYLRFGIETCIQVNDYIGIHIDRYIDKSWDLTPGMAKTYLIGALKKAMESVEV